MRRRLFNPETGELEEVETPAPPQRQAGYASPPRVLPQVQPIPIAPCPAPAAEKPNVFPLAIILGLSVGLACLYFFIMPLIASKKKTGEAIQSERFAGVPIEVRKAIPVSSLRQTTAATVHPVTRKNSNPTESDNSAAKRQKILSGHYNQSDITVFIQKASTERAGKQKVVVSVFGKPIAAAQRFLVAENTPREILTFKVTFPTSNAEQPFDIFLKRDNNINLVYLDINEVLGILDKAIQLHDTARASKSDSYQKKISTGVTLASSCDFDSWLQGTSTRLVFIWNKENASLPLDSYPIMKESLGLPTGNLGSNPQFFTIYDAKITRKALSVLRDAFKRK